MIVDPQVDLTPLEREMRAGVPHYKRGQHQAIIEDRETAILIYVDAMGWACIVPCIRGENDQWKPYGVACRMSCNGPAENWRKLRKSYRLSKASVEALEKAAAEQ